MTLALGTVQFGLPYGIANRTGQVDGAAVAAILKTARAAGLDTLDTAIAYGQSEMRLGEAGVDGWQVVTKLPEMPADADPAVWVPAQFAGSLARLKVSRVKGVLLHRPLQLLLPQGGALWAALQNLKACGQVEKIGFSIYGPEELDALAAFPPDLVQSPFNILDRRLVVSGWLDRLTNAGCEVHIRSAFLQGLLLMARESRPQKFARWADIWAAWHGWLAETRLSPLAACLAFVAAETRISRIVVGVDSLPQFNEILAASQAHQSLQPPAGLEIADVDLINPARWGVLA